MRSRILILLMILCASVNAQTKVIAHRGFWNTKGSAQNSLRSLTKADSIGCFGSEFDIWITTDGKVMVNHDGVYDGKVIETSKYSELKDLRLNNGEKLPTLESYFKQAKKLKVNLILEVKQHKSLLRQNLAIDKTLSLAKKMKLTHRIIYISFSFDAVKRLIAEAPRGTEVYYLGGDKTPSELKSAGCSGPDYYEGTLKAHPDWIDESHRFGMKVNVWTVDETENLKYFINKGVDFITTNNPVLLQGLLQ
jgi:glycerophosphoryl diester phosphodiesterase